MERDEMIMVSTQACVLPLTNGFCEFGVQLYNYQTRPDDPSLAVIVSSSQGTSTAAITTSRQVLYFNKNGRAHPFEARRLEEDRKERNVDNLPKLQLTDDEKERNVLVVFHVPLKQRMCSRVLNGFDNGFENGFVAGSDDDLEYGCADCDDDEVGASNADQPIAYQYQSFDCSESKTSYRGFDAAVLRVSQKDDGVFLSLKPDVKYVRDERFPIRCVVQTYAGTDTADVNDETIRYITQRLAKAYESSSAKGSHVVDDNNSRITAPHTGPTPPHLDMTNVCVPLTQSTPSAYTIPTISDDEKMLSCM